MNVNDVVKSKATGKLYTVIKKKENRDGFLCSSLDSNDLGTYYFFEDEVEIVSEIEETNALKESLNIEKLWIFEIEYKDRTRTGGVIVADSKEDAEQKLHSSRPGMKIRGESLSVYSITSLDLSEDQLYLW